MSPFWLIYHCLKRLQATGEVENELVMPWTSFDRIWQGKRCANRLCPSGFASLSSYERWAHPGWSCGSFSQDCNGVELIHSPPPFPIKIDFFVLVRGEVVARNKSDQYYYAWWPRLSLRSYSGEWQLETCSAPRMLSLATRRTHLAVEHPECKWSRGSRLYYFWIVRLRIVDELPAETFDDRSLRMCD